MPLIVELALLVVLAYFLLVSQAVVLENLGPLAALRRSRELVQGSVRRGLVIVIATCILSFLVSTLPRCLPRSCSYGLPAQTYY